MFNSYFPKARYVFFLCWATLLHACHTYAIRCSPSNLSVTLGHRASVEWEVNIAACTQCNRSISWSKTRSGIEIGRCSIPPCYHCEMIGTYKMDDRFSLTVGESGQRLEIKISEVSFRDAGEYALTIDDDGGNVTQHLQIATFNLTVLEEESPLYDNDFMTTELNNGSHGDSIKKDCACENFNTYFAILGVLLGIALFAIICSLFFSRRQKHRRSNITPMPDTNQIINVAGEEKKLKRKPLDSSEQLQMIPSVDNLASNAAHVKSSAGNIHLAGMTRGDSSKPSTHADIHQLSRDDLYDELRIPGCPSLEMLDGPASRTSSLPSSRKHVVITESPEYENLRRPASTNQRTVIK